MDTRVKSLTRALKAYDYKLFAQRRRDGVICVMRDSELRLSCPNFIMALTNNWTVEGRPVEWGIEVVINRLKAHDLWNNDTFVTNWLKEEEKETESRDKARRNSIESFLYDFRSQFAKATNDINTGNFDKKNDPRRRKEGSHGSL
jgi:SOS response regulatory protein OraA/RecX